MRLSDNQRERLARESRNERVARLERMSTNPAKGEIGKRVSGHRTSVLLIYSYNIILEPNNTMTLRTPQLNDITKLSLGTGNIMPRSASVPGC